MKMTTLAVDIRGVNGKFVGLTPILVREDWAKVKVSSYNEVDINQCVRNELGQLVFVYPADGFGDF